MNKLGIAGSLARSPKVWGPARASALCVILGSTLLVLLGAGSVDASEQDLADFWRRFDDMNRRLAERQCNSARAFLESSIARLEALDPGSMDPYWYDVFKEHHEQNVGVWSRAVEQTCPPSTSTQKEKCPDGITDAGIDSAEDLKTAHEYAMLARSTYDHEVVTVGEWQKIDSYYDPLSGFHVAIYRRETGEVAAVFEGTRTPDTAVYDHEKEGVKALKLLENVRDMLADAYADVSGGGNNPTLQWQEAKVAAAYVKRKYGSNAVFVGHSLGGGLATVAGTHTGNPVVTFNSMDPPRSATGPHDFQHTSFYHVNDPVRRHANNVTNEWGTVRKTSEADHVYLLDYETDGTWGEQHSMQNMEDYFRQKKNERCRH